MEYKIGDEIKLGIVVGYEFFGSDHIVEARSQEEAYSLHEKYPNEWRYIIRIGTEKELYYFRHNVE